MRKGRQACIPDRDGNLGSGNIGVNNFGDRNWGRGNIGAFVST